MMMTMMMTDDDGDDINNDSNDDSDNDESCMFVCLTLPIFFFLSSLFSNFVARDTWIK